MTMTAINARAVSATREGRVTFGRCVTSEWVKLRSLRSTLLSYLIAAGLIVGLGIMFCLVRAGDWDSLPASQKAIFDPTLTSLRGIYVAQLATGVLAVLTITGEYGTGMIRATLTAVPRRLPVLWAKLTVFAVTTFVAMTITSLVAFEAGQGVLGSKHIEASLTSPGAVRAIVGGALYLTVMGVLGIGIGTILRSTAGAVATLMGLLLVLPLLAEALPDPLGPNVIKFLPMPAGTAIMATKHDPTTLYPWPGMAVLAGYAVVAVVAGAIVLHRRDA